MTLVIVGLYKQGATSSLDAADQLVAVEIRREVNRIPEAKLVFNDGDVATQAYPLSKLADLQPGAELTIKAQYESEAPEVLFAGLVVRQRIVCRDDKIELHVELRDKAIKMTSPRKSAIYRDQGDDEILAECVEASGLTTADFPLIAVTHDELVRYDVSDWDFTLMRADVMGLLVRVVDGVVTFADVDTPPDDATVHVIDVGVTAVNDFELELDGVPQPPTVAARAWDPKTNKPTDPVSADPYDIEIGAPKGSAIAEAIGFTDLVLDAMVPLDEPQLSAWANSRMLRSRAALVRGRLDLPGRGKAAPLDTVELSGVGDVFLGTALVGAVVQKIDLEGWHTILELGVAAAPFAREPEIVDLPAGGLLPPVSGLQIGVVAAYKKDETGDGYRVQVTLPNFDAEYGAIWARMAWPDAGPGRGFVSWPAVEDEVVVGFLNDDPRQAVVLGSLYSATNTPPELVGPPTGDNFRKGFFSAKGVTIGVDDERPAVFVQTALDDKIDKIEIDAKAKTIVIVDQHENNITLSADGVSITTKGAFTVSADGDVKILGASIDLAPP